MTLVDLQRTLNDLAPGEPYRLSYADYQHLFGKGGDARARCDHFAAGHGCTVANDAGERLFRFTKRTGSEPAA